MNHVSDARQSYKTDLQGDCVMGNGIMLLLRPRANLRLAMVRNQPFNYCRAKANPNRLSE
jgi:hypothetical protein